MKILFAWAFSGLMPARGHCWFSLSFEGGVGDWRDTLRAGLECSERSVGRSRFQAARAFPISVWLNTWPLLHDGLFFCLGCVPVIFVFRSWDSSGCWWHPSWAPPCRFLASFGASAPRAIMDSARCVVMSLQMIQPPVWIFGKLTYSDGQDKSHDAWINWLILQPALRKQGLYAELTLTSSLIWLVIIVLRPGRSLTQLFL